MFAFHQAHETSDKVRAGPYHHRGSLVTGGKTGQKDGEARPVDGGGAGPGRLSMAGLFQALTGQRKPSL